MARGKGSLKSLASISEPLRQYIATWHERDSAERTWQKRRLERIDYSIHDLPPMIRLASLRGQGILTAQFFGTDHHQFGGQLPHDPSPEQWLDYWQRFIQQRGHILDLVRRIGLIAEIAKDTDLPKHIHEELAFALYTALLDQLRQQRETTHLYTATTRFSIHLWRQQFPTMGETFNHTKPKADQTTLENLKHKTTLLLKKHIGTHAQIKESWTEQGEQDKPRIQFTLKIKADKNAPWQDYLTIERPRLKPARLAAWTQIQTKLKTHNP